MHPTVANKGDDLYLIHLLLEVARRAFLAVTEEAV